MLNFCRTLVGPHMKMTYEQIADRSGMEARGRTVRAIISEHEGSSAGFINGAAGSGFYCAQHQGAAQPMTRRLLSQARKMTERAERRERFARTLPAEE